MHGTEARSVSHLSRQCASGISISIIIFYPGDISRRCEVLAAEKSHGAMRNRVQGPTSHDLRFSVLLLMAADGSARFK